MRGVGVSNNEIQSVCSTTPAGALGTHKSLLFNGLTTALAIDALRNGGPADRNRSGLAVVCQQVANSALDLVDVIETKALIPIAAANILDYIKNLKGVKSEPAVKAYAT